MLKMVHVEQKDVTISKGHNPDKSYTRNPYNPKKDPTKAAKAAGTFRFSIIGGTQDTEVGFAFTRSTKIKPFIAPKSHQLLHSNKCKRMRADLVSFALSTICRTLVGN